MKFAAVLLLIATSCGSAAGLYVSTAADMATTRIAIRGGANEANPILKHRTFAELCVLEALASYAVVRYANHLKAMGVENWRLPMRILSTFHFGAAGWNATQIMEIRR